MKTIFFVGILFTFINAQVTQEPKINIIEDFDNLSINESVSAHVFNVKLHRDKAIITLQSGTVYLLSPLNNSSHALLYIGDGNISCTPPTDVERKQLYRFTEKESLYVDFESLFLLFTDSTFQEVTRNAVFTPFKKNKSFESTLQKSIRFLRNTKNTGYSLDVLRPFLFNDTSDYFYAHFTDRDHNSYFYQIDPYDLEDISINREYSRRSLVVRENICSFKSQRKDRPDILTNSYDVNSYMVSTVIDDGLNVSSKCSIEMTNKVVNRKWIPFSLFYKLQIDSVFIDTKKGIYIQDDDFSIRWIGSAEPFPVERKTNITLYYHGEIIKKFESVYVLESSMGWYPVSLEDKKYSLFDLTFQYPSIFQLASIGEKIFSQSSGKTSVSRWRLDHPGRNASFMIGKFDVQTFTVDTIPPVSVYIANTVGNDARNEFSNKEVAEDIINSIRFFQYVYGRTTINQFSAVEIFEPHGEAFPGLIHLSALMYRQTYLDGETEIFRAHEVAHQWWGIGVDFKSYHDQWLSEAFAEYSGLWYMQNILKDNDKFFTILDRYKEYILSNRKFLLGDGQESGPIWLGYRTQSSTTIGDYDLVIYRKGAWVLHMLRNIALDLKTMKEDLFRETMKDFYTTYVGKQASTDDFQKIVEKHFGIDMNWFFKQWIYNTAIPTYNITYTLEELPDGKYKVKCLVKQSNVPDDFQMSVPFFINFGNDKFARLRYVIKGPITEFYFPVLPMKPESIKFNDLNSVLCEIDDEDWD